MRIPAKRIGFLFALLLATACAHAADEDPAAQKIHELLRKVREQHHLPAVGGAIVTGEGLKALGVDGMRAAGGADPVLSGDPWHLGSCTKAMTATLAATFVEEGKLDWDTPAAKALPSLEKEMLPARGITTLRQLLSHRADLPHDFPWGMFSSTDLRASRRQAALLALRTPLPEKPGAYQYSNAGYVVAAAMIEELGNDSWENLIRTRLFEPLGMKDCGFGPIATGPQAHGADGKPPVFGTGDNEPIMAPAGTLHMPLSAWAAFVADQLRGARGESRTLLKPATYQTLQTPEKGATYAMGWMPMQRPWGGGTVLTHDGTNTMNYCVVWMAPAKNFAVLAVTNQGGSEAAKACDEIASGLIQLHLGKK